MVWHVDHLVAFERWQRLFSQMAEDAINESESGGDEGSVNDIGNMLLLETNFNIVKSDKPLKKSLEDKKHDDPVPIVVRLRASIEKSSPTCYAEQT